MLWEGEFEESGFCRCGPPFSYKCIWLLFAFVVRFDGKIYELLTEPPTVCFLPIPFEPVVPLNGLRFDFIDFPLILRDCMTRWGGLRVSVPPPLP